MKYPVFLIAAMTFAAPMWAAPPEVPDGVPLVTIAQNAASVRFVPSADATKATLVLDRRAVDLVAGRNAVRFAGVSSSLDLDTVQLIAAEGAPVEVLEQRLLPPPVATLERFVGQTLTLQREGGNVTGKLISLNPILLETDTGVLLSPVGTWVLPKSTLSVTESPSLQWIVNAPNAGRYVLEARYAATGIKWEANYRATLNQAGSALDFQGWIEIANASSADWRNATWTIGNGTNALRAPRPIDIVPIATKQIAFVSRTAVPVTTATVFRAHEGNSDYLKSFTSAPQVTLQFINAEGGAPLPEGALALWQQTKDGDPLLRVQRRLSAVNPGEQVILALGDAPGLLVARGVVSRRLNPRTMEHTVTLRIVNSRAQTEAVTVIEDVPVGAKLSEIKPAPDATPNSNLRWNISVPANGEVTISYIMETKN